MVAAFPSFDISWKFSFPVNQIKLELSLFCFELFSVDVSLVTLLPFSFEKCFDSDLMWSSPYSLNRGLLASSCENASKFRRPSALIENPEVAK